MILSCINMQTLCLITHKSLQEQIICLIGYEISVISGLTWKIKLPTYLRSFKVQLTQSTNKANMKTNKLSKEIRHKVMEKHHSGEGYKEISKSLVIPFEYGEIHHQEVEDVAYRPDSTQIRSPIQTRQSGK